MDSTRIAESQGSRSQPVSVEMTVVRARNIETTFDGKREFFVTIAYGATAKKTKNQTKWSTKSGILIKSDTESISNWQRTRADNLEAREASKSMVNKRGSIGVGLDKGPFRKRDIEAKRPKHVKQEATNHLVLSGGRCATQYAVERDKCLVVMVFDTRVFENGSRIKICSPRGAQQRSKAIGVAGARGQGDRGSQRTKWSMLLMSNQYSLAYSSYRMMSSPDDSTEVDCGRPIEHQQVDMLLPGIAQLSAGAPAGKLCKLDKLAS
ncbi:hypothetical protein EDB84DRAFT_1679874 [Lactarius hengduanensis]|nr:hypothetical protein EDB84DRAFT_1679874 [Lactarius hengduanensis]